MKKYFLLTLLLFIPFNMVSSEPLRSNSDVSESRILDFVKYQLDLGPRIPGTKGIRDFRNWIVSLFQESSVWNVELLPFEYMGVENANILITYKGVDFPKYLIGAHYDTRARATQNNLEQPVPGANDGASGVAAILELTTLLSVYNSSDIGFLLIDAEDQGNDGRGYGINGWSWIVGSTYFVDSLDQNQTNLLEYFILLDMIGNPNILLEYEGYSTDWLKEAIWNKAADLGYEETFVPVDGVSLTDDHRPFLNRGIDAVDIIDFKGYGEWHTTGDNLEAISTESIAIVTDVVLEYLIDDLNLSKVNTQTESLVVDTNTSRTYSYLETTSYPNSLILPITISAVTIFRIRTKKKI